MWTAERLPVSSSTAFASAGGADRGLRATAPGRRRRGSRRSSRRRGQLAHGLDRLVGHGVVEVDRADRAAGERAHVVDRAAELPGRDRVALEAARQAAAAPGREARGLAGGVEGVDQAARARRRRGRSPRSAASACLGLARARAPWRRARARSRTARARAACARARAARGRPGAERARHDQRDAAADERVVEAGEVEAAARAAAASRPARRRRAGLGGEQRAAADERRAPSIASPTTTPICQVPVPISATSSVRDRDARRATPTAISTARRRRSPTVRPSVITAETGAKNGCSWPTTSVAISQASAAATADCRIGRAVGDDAVAARAQAGARGLGGLLEQLVAARDELAGGGEAVAAGVLAVRLTAGTSAATRSGGGRSAARAPTSTRRLVEGDVARQRVAEVARRGRRPPPRARRTRGQGDEVGGGEVDALVRVAVQLLVEAQHPVAAVVDDHCGERDPLLRGGGQLAAGVEEAAVAGDAHHRARCRPARRRAPAGSRSRACPSRAGRQPARGRRRSGSRRSSSRGCTCRRPRVASAGSARSSAVEERGGSGSVALELGAHRGAQRGDARRASASRPARCATASASAAAPARGVASISEVGRVVLRRVGGIDVERDQRAAAAGMLPAQGHHAVEVGADREHDVGLVPERPDLGHVRRARRPGRGGRAAAGRGRSRW